MRVEDGWAAYTEGLRYESSVNHFPCFSVYLVETSLLAYHPHKFSWSHLQPVAYAMQMIILPSSMPPMQFLCHFHWGHFLLYLFPVSDFHSCIDKSKEVFKSISNKRRNILNYIFWLRCHILSYFFSSLRHITNIHIYIYISGDPRFILLKLLFYA